MTAHAAVDCAPMQWHGADSVAQWPPVMKALLKECEILVKNAEGPCVEAAVDIFCRICELRGRCASLPTAPMLLACVRCDSLHSWLSAGWLMMQSLTRCHLPSHNRLATELCMHAAATSAGCHGVISRFTASARALLHSADPLLVRPKPCVAPAPIGSHSSPLRQATTAQRATSALQALQRACDATGAWAGRVPAVDEMRTVMEPKDDEQDLEPDEYDASSDDADDAAYCMQPAD